MAPLKSFILLLVLCSSFSFADVRQLNLSAGDSITIGDATVTCENDNVSCDYIAGNVYCGAGCEYIAGNVYCSEQTGWSCTYIAGNVYCGVGCKYIAGNVYCAKGGLGKPATPAKP